MKAQTLQQLIEMGGPTSQYRIFYSGAWRTIVDVYPFSTNRDKPGVGITINGLSDKKYFDLDTPIKHMSELVQLREAELDEDELREALGALETRIAQMEAESEQLKSDLESREYEIDIYLKYFGEQRLNEAMEYYQANDEQEG